MPMPFEREAKLSKRKQTVVTTREEQARRKELSIIGREQDTVVAAEVDAAASVEPLLHSLKCV